MDSVLNQSYLNFERLILDYCSTDNSYSILEQYQRDHSNIKLVKSEINLGFNRNFEKSILLSEGDLISICDQDDVWLPDKLEELVTNIGNAQLIYSDSELIDSQGNLWAKSFLAVLNIWTILTIKRFWILTL